MSKIYQMTLRRENPAEGILGGFTLIELLVVVLIIGILAAIAMPQYERAVEKARSSEALTLLRSAADAVKLYYLANGSYPDSFDDLDIQIPYEAESATVRSNGEWTMTLLPGKVNSTAQGAGVYILRAKGKYARQGFYYFIEEDNKKMLDLYCVETSCDTTNYCKNIMGLSNVERMPGWTSRCVAPMM